MLDYICRIGHWGGPMPRERHAMKVCLSPNGRAESRGAGPATELLVATIRGLRVFERTAADDPWRETIRAIEDRHLSSLLFDSGSGVLFAGLHGRGEEGG